MYIESVRDNSLHTLDNILNGGAKASSIKKLNEELKSLSLTTDTIKLIQRIATRMLMQLCIIHFSSLSKNLMAGNFKSRRRDRFDSQYF